MPGPITVKARWWFEWEDPDVDSCDYCGDRIFLKQLAQYISIENGKPSRLWRFCQSCGEVLEKKDRKDWI